MVLLISGLYSIDDRIINEHGEVGVGREQFLGENLPLRYFVH
jgi:hypothetical protein